MKKLTRRNEAERAQKEAQKISDTLTSWESAQYWTFRKQKAEASFTVNEIDREIAEKSTKTDQRKYLKRTAELQEEKKEITEKKIRRYEARSRIIEAAKIINPIFMRASYLELMMSLLSMTSRSSQGAFIYDPKEKNGC